MRKVGFCLSHYSQSLLDGCVASEPRFWDSIGVKVACAIRIKSLLNDPDSYEFELVSITESSGEYNEYGKAQIIYAEQNVSE